MSIGSWDPDVGTDSTAVDISSEWLARCIGYSQSDQLDDLASVIPADDRQRYAPLMQYTPDEWLAAVADLDSDSLRHLVRFYTVAENLPGWHSGHLSPVIVFARLLRQRGEKLDRDLLLWIRSHSDNRFLPYGPL